MLIDSSEQLVRRYEKMRQEMLDMNEPSDPRKEWVGDCQKLHDIFGIQETLTKQQLDRLLSKKASSSREAKTDNNGRTIPNVWTLLTEDGGAIKENSGLVKETAWTDIAGRAQSDIRRLMKHLEEG
jgi:hypothetical protein